MDRPMGTLKAMVEAHMKPMAMITGNRSALWPISVARAKEPQSGGMMIAAATTGSPPKRANTGPEHLGDEDFQEGNRGHQPANGDEHVRHGVQAVLKGPAQLRLVIDNVGDSADDTAGHHEIGNERSDEFHGAAPPARQPPSRVRLREKLGSSRKEHA